VCGHLYQTLLKPWVARRSETSADGIEHTRVERAERINHRWRQVPSCSSKVKQTFEIAGTLVECRAGISLAFKNSFFWLAGFAFLRVEVVVQEKLEWPVNCRKVVPFSRTQCQEL